MREGGSRQVLFLLLAVNKEMAVARTAMVIGQCLPCLKSTISKFNVTKMVLDVNLKMVSEVIM